MWTLCVCVCIYLHGMFAPRLMCYCSMHGIVYHWPAGSCNGVANENIPECCAVYEVDRGWGGFRRCDIAFSAIRAITQLGVGGMHVGGVRMFD